MSTVDGGQPSTPSRKRSRWDVDDGSSSPPPEVQSTKRRAKSSQPPREPSAPPTQIVQQSQASGSSRKQHSVYVPPRTSHPPILPSRSVYCYERLNSIEEGSYGVVFRARDKQTGDIVALKKLKLDEEKHGFPITALREINALMTCRHENVVGIREVVVGETLTQCVVIVVPCLIHCSYHVNFYISQYKSVHCHGFHRA